MRRTDLCFFFFFFFLKKWSYEPSEVCQKVGLCVPKEAQVTISENKQNIRNYFTNPKCVDVLFPWLNLYQEAHTDPAGFFLAGSGILKNARQMETAGAVGFLETLNATSVNDWTKSSPNSGRDYVTAWGTSSREKTS